MSWQDRLRPAAYTSPNGTRILFTYEDVSMTFERKTTAFDFPDADGTYIQDLGRTSRRYPVRIIFWGDDYDLQADTFEKLLAEKGIGRLEHPAYGTIDVIPFGTITRRDALKTAANQAVFELIFFETTGLIYPTTQRNPGSSVSTAITDFNETAAQQFADSANLESAVERAAFRNDYDRLLSQTREGLDTVASFQDSVREQFNTISDSINLGIDTLIGDPLTLAFQTVLLIQTPASIIETAAARLDAYTDLATSLISDGDAAVSSGFDSRPENTFYTSELYATAYMTGAVLSVTNTEFETKAEALLAAEVILTQLEEINDWREENYSSLAAIDTGAAYQQLQEAVALAAGFLVEISFNLRQEHRITLDRARTIIDVVAEYYGQVDEQLNFFINSNNLTGSEILELPKGKEIVYYI